MNNPLLHDIGKVIKVHPKREPQALPAVPKPAPLYVPEPVQPSERAARRRKMCEGPIPEPEPVQVPVEVPEKGKS